MLSDALISTVAVQAAIGVATVAAVKVGLSNLEKRVDKNEEKLDRLPSDYVPRSEVELGLNSLRDLAEKTYSLVEAFFSGGRSIHAGAESPQADPLDELTAWANEALALAKGDQERRIEIAKVLALCYLARERRAHDSPTTTPTRSQP